MELREGIREQGEGRMEQCDDTREQDDDVMEFKASLVYRVSSRTAWGSRETLSQQDQKKI